MSNFGPREDLTGKQFGEWTVLEYKGKSTYLCRCSCGIERIIRKQQLTTGLLSCPNHPREDLTNRQFGEWTVYKYAGSSKWICKCSCGTAREISTTVLKHSKPNYNCGHLNKSGTLRKVGPVLKHDKRREVRENLTGMRFGEWTVLEHANGRGEWLCRCDCGKLSNVRAYSLKNGISKSCGTHGQYDLTGKRSKEWTVLQYSKEHKSWLCQCDCGTLRYYDTTILVHGRHAINCGHNKRKENT